MQCHSLALQMNQNSVVTVQLQSCLFCVPVVTDLLTCLPACLPGITPWMMTAASRWHLPGETHSNFLLICQRSVIKHTI